MHVHVLISNSRFLFTNIDRLQNISKTKQENLHNYNIHLCVEKITADQ